MRRQRIRIVTERGIEPMFEPTLERWFTESYRRGNPHVMARIGALIRATPVAGYVGCCHAIPKMNVTDRLGNLRCATLVLVGEQDAGTPVAMAQEIAQAIPGARLEIIPDAAHLSNIQQATTFNRLLREFLDAQH
jgi:3-oxoadipate enol-lactonase